MNRRLKGFYQMMTREAGYILRDRNIITIVLLSPLFYAFFYCSIYMNKTERDIDVVIVDMDHSKTSEQLIKDIDAHGAIKVINVTGNLEEAKKDIYSMKAQGVVYIDVDCEKNYKRGKGIDLKVYLNTTRFLVSNDINKALNEIALDWGIKSRVKFFESAGNSPNQSVKMADPLGVDLRSLFNTTESYGDFMISGIIILILQQTMMIGLGESVAKERENHTIKELYHTANGSPWALILGKGSIYFILYSAYAFFFFTFIFNMYGQRLEGSLWALIVTTALLFLAIIFICVFIASFFERKIMALQFIVFTTYPLFLISGYSWPIPSMPVSLQYLTQILPSTQYLNSFARIAQMGAGFYDVLPEIRNLFVIVVVSMILARWRIKILVSKEDDIQVDTLFQKIGKALKKA
jgi:ABC-2 type transport system permease protein